MWWDAGNPQPGPAGWLENPNAISAQNPAAPGSPIAAVAREANHLDVFWIDPNGGVQTVWWDAGNPQPGPAGWLENPNAISP